MTDRDLLQTLTAGIHSMYQLTRAFPHIKPNDLYNALRRLREAGLTQSAGREMYAITDEGRASLVQPTVTPPRRYCNNSMLGTYRTVHQAVRDGGKDHLAVASLGNKT